MHSIGIKKLYLLASLICFSPVHANVQKLENYNYLGEFSMEQAKTALQKNPPLDTLELGYNLNLYKINYKTPSPDGSMAIASGLVAMPIVPEKSVAVMSYLHSTVAARYNVPSSNNENYYIYLATFGSSGGYMVVMPDYIGLGDNTSPVHPYAHSDTLASSSIDMIIAAKELANALNYPINDKLFLGGYSEGGLTTMATYDVLLKNHKDIPITAAAAGSAPYDWLETMHFISKTPGPRSSFQLAYFAYTMQTYFHYWSGLDVIFKKPFDTDIPALIDGYHELTDILELIPQDPYQLFQSEFYYGLTHGTDPNTDTFNKNFNHYNITATSPLLLLGSKGDHFLPFHGAEIAYEALKNKSDKVYIKSVSDVLDHIEAVPSVLKEELAFFKLYESQ